MTKPWRITMPWRRSTKSGGGNCVEVAPGWRKSIRSGGNGACVEVAAVTATETRNLEA